MELRSLFPQPYGFSIFNLIVLYFSVGQEHLVGHRVLLGLPKEIVALSGFTALAEERIDCFFLELICPCGRAGELCHLDRTIIPVPAVVPVVTEAIIGKIS